LSKEKYDHVDYKQMKNILLKNVFLNKIVLEIAFNKEKSPDGKLNQKYKKDLIDVCK